MLKRMNNCVCFRQRGGGSCSPAHADGRSKTGSPSTFLLTRMVAECGIGIQLSFDVYGSKTRAKWYNWSLSTNSWTHLASTPIQATFSPPSLPPSVTVLKLREMCKIFIIKLCSQIICNCMMDEGFNINLVVAKVNFLQTLYLIICNPLLKDPMHLDSGY